MSSLTTYFHQQNPTKFPTFFIYFYFISLYFFFALLYFLYLSLCIIIKDHWMWNWSLLWVGGGGGRQSSTLWDFLLRISQEKLIFLNIRPPHLILSIRPWKLVTLSLTYWLPHSLTGVVNRLSRHREYTATVPLSSFKGVRIVKMNIFIHAAHWTGPVSCM